MHTFKICVVGHAQGKTAFVHRLLTGDFEEKYVATLGVEVYPIRMTTNNLGSVCCNFWDCAGQEKYGGLADGYHLAADAFLVFLDYAHPENWDAEVAKYTGRTRIDGSLAPVIAVLSRRDLYQDQTHALHNQLVAILQKHHIRGYTHSTRTGFNIVTPLLDVVRQLTGDQALEFI